jgi:hypothetical protein
MWNRGIVTREVGLVPWLLAPDASESEIVAAMRLPRHLSVEALAIDELAAVADYHRVWSGQAKLDTAELFLRNTACKRALYLSAPIFLPDTIGAREFTSSGVNTRLHLYRGDDVRDSVRLEAISSYELAGFRLRYALSIQYAADEIGRGWQVLRPVVVLDRRLLSAVEDQGGAAVADLERVLAALRRLVLIGSHDYVHATVLNWFPPVQGFPADYTALLSERPHPPELDRWHAATQGRLPDDLVPGRPTPGMAVLELYSLQVHGETVAAILDHDPGAGADLRELLAEYAEACESLLGRDIFADPQQTQGARDYLAFVAGWFLVSALPIGSAQLAVVGAGWAGERRDALLWQLGDLHDGMFDFVQHTDPYRFPWDGRTVSVHDVTAEYEVALRLPALREHAEYLATPRRRAGPRPWIETLAKSVTATDADRTVVDGLLTGLREVATVEGSRAGVARLHAGGGLAALRSVAGLVDGGGSEGGTAEAFARAVAGSLERVLSALDGERANDE